MSRAHEPASATQEPDEDLQVQDAASQGVIGCHHCGTVWQGAQPQHCGVCHAPCVRKIDSLTRTWALLAACIMYIPANMMPVMVTSTLLDEQRDTILSGVIYFWTSGEWGLALVVFVASFLVPLFKLVALGILVISARRRSRWQRLQQAKLYRLVEAIGRWSMLDVFVVSVLTGLVKIHGFANVHAGIGIAAFGAVVVLTMLASLSFDPRLIWDVIDPTPQASSGQFLQQRNRKPHDSTRPFPMTNRRCCSRRARQRNWLPSLVWLIPIIAAIVGLTLVAKILVERGPVVTVSFRSAEGLEAGKTKVKYKDVEIGQVQTLKLAPTVRMCWSVSSSTRKPPASMPKTRASGWSVHASPPPVSRAGHLALGRLHRCRCRCLGRDQKNSSAWSSRPSSPAMPRGASSCCIPMTWVRSISVSPFSIAASRWVRWWPMTSTRWTWRDPAHLRQCTLRQIRHPGLALLACQRLRHGTQCQRLQAAYAGAVDGGAGRHCLPRPR
jgi:paraquat-inducible protein A